MSNNVLSIIDIVFGKFKRKFYNKIYGILSHTCTNERRIKYMYSLEIQTVVYVVIAAR